MCTTKSCSHWLFHFCSIIILIIITSSINGGASDDSRKVYIVYMGSLPKGEYSPLSHHLRILQDVINGSLVSKHIVRSYTKSFNGFAARLTHQEQEKIANMEEVVSVFPSTNLKLHTTRSWDFMGLSESVKRVPKVESDMVIGVLDGGIWIKSESFNDEGFSPPPKKWKGVCAGGKKFTCNNKVIGARNYIPYERYVIDKFGHGTHTASIAAGNIVKGVGFYGLAQGNARGGVPSARIAVYKVCDGRGYCLATNILAAFDDAIYDGVDVISVSIGSSFATAYFRDPTAIGAFHAMERGVLTSISAGNEGPVYGSVTSIAPWEFTVAASSTDRRIINKVVLGDGTTIVGDSVNPFKMNGTKFPLVYGKDASRRCNEARAKSCAIFCLDRSLVKGKIVLCDALKGLQEALRVNALGVILLAKHQLDYSTVVPFPSIILSKKDGDKIKSYINSTKIPEAKIMKSKAVKDTTAPTVPLFSSRGPNRVQQNILKPDITAPGVNILAAFSPHGNPFNGLKNKYKVTVNYAIQSGTSMSCPHVAAAAAYVKTFRPQWSPSAIKSALMTTAWPMKATKNRGSEFAYGAGHINPIQAVNPGLVYDAQVGDYIKLLCNTGYSSVVLEMMSRDNHSCPVGRKGTVWELNYPSFTYFYSEKGPFKVKFPRTVTNVGNPNSTYKVSVSLDNNKVNVTVNVMPQVLSFNSLGAKKPFVVIIVGSEMIWDSMVSGSLVWSDGTHSVRSPIVVYGYGWKK